MPHLLRLYTTPSRGCISRTSQPTQTQIHSGTKRCCRLCLLPCLPTFPTCSGPADVIPQVSSPHFIWGPLSSWITFPALFARPPPQAHQMTCSPVRCTVSHEASHSSPKRPHSGPDQVPSFCLSVNVWGFFSDSVSACLCSKPAWLLLVSPLHPFGALGKLSFPISEDKKYG